jgi:hypothetical protein
MHGVANRVIVLLSTVGLARILAPPDFGLLQVALTSVAAIAVQMLRRGPAPSSAAGGHAPV